MKNKDVLELKYEKLDDYYTKATIIYQDYNVLKRCEFRDVELRIYSRNYPEYDLSIYSDDYPDYFFNNIYIQGNGAKYDDRPLIIPNDDLEDFKERIKKLNEKYGVIKNE